MNTNSKEDFQQILKDLLNPLKPFYSKLGARLNLGNTSAVYEDDTVPMEAFSRPLWGLVPFWAGGGQDEELEKLSVSGLIAGTDPEGEEYWGNCRDFDQKFVEMAAIASGLLYQPEKLWEPLSDKQKDNLESWLLNINDYTSPDNNWQMFAVLVNTAFKKLGRRYSEERLEYGLGCLERYYLGNGWYADGYTDQKDYYISFAIHYYSLLYAKAMEKEDPRRSALYKERAVEFAKTFIYWFSEDGASLVFGRSLTYRFAQVSFWGACLFAGIEPFSVGVMKGLIARHLEDWLSAPIFDNAGVLTIGYKYPNLHMAEGYNAPGSPYWSMKAFLFLALPDEHPFWSVPAEPMPELDTLKLLPEAEMLVQRLPHQVIAYPGGNFCPHSHVHVNCKYGKFAYSSYFGFSVPRTNYTLEEAAPDSMLAFEVDGFIYVRQVPERYRVEEDRIHCEWSPRKGILVDTEIIPTEEGHIRRHKVVSAHDCKAYDCGFAVSINSQEGLIAQEGKGFALAENAASKCQMISLSENGNGVVIGAEPNTNLVFSKTRIPAIEYTVKKGENLYETEIKACIKNV